MASDPIWHDSYGRTSEEVLAQFRGEQLLRRSDVVGRYNRSEKGRAQRGLYSRSLKGRAVAQHSDCSEQGKARKRRFNNSERGKATRRRYSQTDRGREVIGAAMRRYLQTEKGRLDRRRSHARWFGDTGDLYDRNRYQMLYVEKLPCVQCSEADTLKLCVDHVIPRGLGGSHERVNLQVLCQVCHKSKTQVDMRTIHESRLAA